MTDLQTYVYFVATEDHSMVKIGHSSKPVMRLDNLQVWSPVKLVLLAAVPGRSQDERALHRRYLSQYSHKEWFRSTPEMLADIAAIARFGELPSAFRGADNEANPIVAKHSIRATPEWRAKISLVHKDRWARQKKARALDTVIQEFLSRNDMTLRQFNAAVGFDALHQWNGCVPRFSEYSQLLDLERAEAFINSPAEARVQ